MSAYVGCVNAEWSSVCCSGGESNVFRGNSPSAVCADAVAAHDAWGQTVGSCVTLTFESVEEFSPPIATLKKCHFSRFGQAAGANGECVGEEQDRGAGNLSVSFLEQYKLEDQPQPTCNREGNPCDVVTGKKTQYELDYQDAFIEFGRHYESGRADPVTWIGAYWRHSFDSTMNRQLPAQPGFDSFPRARVESASSLLYGNRGDACAQGWQAIKNSHMRGMLSSATSTLSGSTCLIQQGGTTVHSLAVVKVGGFGDAGSAQVAERIVSRPDGGFYTFTKSLGVWIEQNGYQVELVEISPTRYAFKDVNGVIDTFDNFVLVERLMPAGDSLTFSYTQKGQLETVTHSSGRVYQFTYNENGQVDTFSHPSGSIGYRYDQDYNLEFVDYEDGGTRQYHYDDMNFDHIDYWSD